MSDDLEEDHDALSLRYYGVKRRIAQLETAASEFLDFAYGNQLPNDEPKSEMLRLANRLYHVVWQDEDPGAEYGAGGSIDPAPDAKEPK